MSDSDDQIGPRIREAMLKRGYRRDDGEPDVRNFAFDHRLDRSHLYMWMNNTMKPFKHIVQLAQALDVSIEWLLTGKERDPKASPGKARRQPKLRGLLLALTAASAALLSPSVGTAGDPLPIENNPSYRKFRRCGVAPA